MEFNQGDDLIRTEIYKDYSWSYAAYELGGGDERDG